MELLEQPDITNMDQTTDNKSLTISGIDLTMVDNPFNKSMTLIPTPIIHENIIKVEEWSENSAEFRPKPPKKTAWQNQTEHSENVVTDKSF